MRSGVPRVLVRLKLRLLRNGLKRGGPAKVTFVLAVVVAALLGVVGFIAGIALGADEGPTHALAPPIAFAVVWLGWTLIPLAAFGTDETLDPARLALFPLRRRDLVTGLALASLVGPAPSVVLGSALGIVAGYGWGRAFPLVAAAAALGVAAAVLTSRLLSTALAAALTSRRGRDVAVAVVSVVVLAVQGVRFLPGRVHISESTWRRIADVAAWTPPGLLGRAVVDADRARFGVAALELLPAVVLVAVAAVLWSVALRRAVTMPEARGAVHRVASDRTGLRLRRRRPWLPAGAVGAVAARELIAGRRDPRRRVGLVNTSLVAIAGTVVLVLQADQLGGPVVLATSATAGLGVLAAFNQLGLDGAGMWLDVAAPGSARAVLTGKNVAVAAQVLPVVAVGAVAVAASSGGWAYIPATLLLGTGGLGAGLAVADVIAVSAPMAVPERGNPLGGGNVGQGCAAGLAVLLGSLALGVVLAPPAVAIALSLAAGAPVVTAVAVAAAAYGAGVWFGGRAIATGMLADRQPEVLAAVDPRLAS